MIFLEINSEIYPGMLCLEMPLRNFSEIEIGFHSGITQWIYPGAPLDISEEIIHGTLSEVPVTCCPVTP